MVPKLGGLLLVLVVLVVLDVEVVDARRRKGCGGRR
jgi:hypothetical protein